MDTIISFGAAFVSGIIHITIGHPFIGGSLAGFLANGITYPIDTIKTRIQSGESSSLYSAYISKGRYGEESYRVWPVLYS